MKAAPVGRALFACVFTALLVLATAGAASAQFGTKKLKRGSKGHDVKVLQSWLTHLGYRTSVDGEFGSNTLHAVHLFDRKEGLPPDGVVDLREQALLRKRMGEADGSSPVSAPAERAQLASDGKTAIAPASAPDPVKQVIAAANQITDAGYRYGGGHADFNDTAYDCSGAVSYALHGAGLVSHPLDSNDFFSWGNSGRGQWITVYTQSSHAYLVVAGLRFDTSGSGETGPRWRTEARSSSGYVARHPAGL
jgi:cell wall-associated NlpC family hydrolase